MINILFNYLPSCPRPEHPSRQVALQNTGIVNARLQLVLSDLILFREILESCGKVLLYCALAVWGSNAMPGMRANGAR